MKKTHAGAFDQELSTDMTNAESSADVFSNEVMAGQRTARSVHLHFVLIMLCTGRALDRIASAPLDQGMQAWRLIFQACSPKNNASLVVMMVEVLAFPFDINDAVKSLETMERNITEFERYANIEIPEFLKIGTVIRQAEGGPMRTHVIMNSLRLATFQDIKREVTHVEQAQSAVMARSGDAMDVDAFTKGYKSLILLILLCSHHRIPFHICHHRPLLSFRSLTQIFCVLRDHTQGQDADNVFSICRT